MPAVHCVIVYDDMNGPDGCLVPLDETKFRLSELLYAKKLLYGFHVYYGYLSRASSGYARVHAKTGKKVFFSR